MQIPNINIYESGTDKGFHRVPGVSKSLTDTGSKEKAGFDIVKLVKSSDLGVIL